MSEKEDFNCYLNANNYFLLFIKESEPTPDSHLVFVCSAGGSIGVGKMLYPDLCPLFDVWINWRYKLSGERYLITRGDAMSQWYGSFKDWGCPTR